MADTEKEKNTDGLIRAVKAGDSEAFEKLAAEYRGMITAQVGSFASSFASADPGKDAAFSVEDLVQEAQIAFLRAARSYDPESAPGVTFGLYSKICVRNAMISLLRKLRTRKRRKPAAGGREPVAEETRARLPDPEAVVGLAAGSLSKLEAEIIGRYAAGDKPSQIAASLGKSEKTVYNALYRAKTKIRKLR